MLRRPKVAESRLKYSSSQNSRSSYGRAAAPAFVVRITDIVGDAITPEETDLISMCESEANYECLSIGCMLHVCPSCHLRVLRQRIAPYSKERTRGGHFSMTAPPCARPYQPTVGDAAEINSGSHRSGAKLNFPFPESTPRTPRTPPARRRRDVKGRWQAHMGEQAPARTCTQALTLKLLLSGSRCVHCLFLTRSPSLPPSLPLSAPFSVTHAPNVDLR